MFWTLKDSSDFIVEGKNLTRGSSSASGLHLPSKICSLICQLAFRSRKLHIEYRFISKHKILSQAIGAIRTLNHKMMYVPIPHYTIRKSAAMEDIPREIPMADSK